MPSILDRLQQLVEMNPASVLMKWQGVTPPTPMEAVKALLPQAPPRRPKSNNWLDLIDFALAQPGMLPVGATVYHGTPHRFAPTAKNPLGEFDMSKMGTGEGAQSYGHGMYVADSPEVARTYQNRGAMYKVDLPDEHIANMLDWDVPLSQQPEKVRQAISKYQQNTKRFSGWGPGAKPLPPHNFPDDMTGAQLYQELSGGRDLGEAGGPGAAQASATLRKHGIPGLKYYDQGSRAAGKGSRNYVVWDDILKILGEQ